MRPRIRARLARKPNPTPSAAPRTRNACLAATFATGALAAATAAVLGAGVIACWAGLVRLSVCAVPT